MRTCTMALRRVRLLVVITLISGFGLTAAQVQAQYTVQFLPPPTGGQPPGAITPYALNNEGQVFGRNHWGFYLGGAGPDRGPVLWTDAVPAALPLPAGYSWYDTGGGLLNDAGVAVSTVHLDSATANQGIRAVVWQNGAATVVPVPLPPSDCGSRFNIDPPYTQFEFNVWPVGLNRAGHILISACNSLWIVDSTGAVLSAGPPPAIFSPVGLQPVYFVTYPNGGNHLNDADVASAETGLFGFNTLTHPGILSGLSSFFPLPVDHGYAHGINNRNQVLTFIQDAGSSTADCWLWEGAAMAGLGTCASASLNNLGQVAFMTNTFAPQLRLYKDGAVSAITSPPETPGLVFTSGNGLNDCGQIIGQDQFSRGVLLTPFGPCTSDSTPPSITVPGDIIAEATSPSGAAVTFTALATDDTDGSVPVVCAPASGSTFPRGTTTVNCSATDQAGNAATASFTVTVRDTTPPTITCPSDMTVFQSSAYGAVVTFSPTASDTVSAVTVSSSPASGSTFPLGTTTVTCRATDAAGNSSSCSFKVTVVAPASTVGVKSTAGGSIALTGGIGTFGIVAMASSAGVPQGNVEYQDHVTGMNVKSTAITAIVATGTHARIFGKAKINGAGSYDFVVDVDDLGEPGIGSDTFGIQISNGYSSGPAPLRGGNIQIRK